MKAWLTRGRVLLLAAFVVLMTLAYVQSLVLGILLATLIYAGIGFRIRERASAGQR